MGFFTGYTTPQNIKDPNVFLVSSFRLKGLCMTARCQALKDNLEGEVEEFRRFLEFYGTDLKNVCRRCKSCKQQQRYCILIYIVTLSKLCL